MAFTDQAALARNDEFIYRVRVALCKTCIAVANEADNGGGSVAQHNLRIAYATKVLNDPDQAAIRMAWGVVTNATITAAASDNDIEFQVTSIFDGYAGVVPATEA